MGQLMRNVSNCIYTSLIVVGHCAAWSDISAIFSSTCIWGNCWTCLTIESQTDEVLISVAELTLNTNANSDERVSRSHLADTATLRGLALVGWPCLTQRWNPLGPSAAPASLPLSPNVGWLFLEELSACNVADSELHRDGIVGGAGGRLWWVDSFGLRNLAESRSLGGNPAFNYSSADWIISFFQLYMSASRDWLWRHKYIQVFPALEFPLQKWLAWAHTSPMLNYLFQDDCSIWIVWSQFHFCTRFICCIKSTSP